MTRRTNVLLALALALSAAPACDEAIEGDFGEGDIALRPGGFGSSGLYLNTNSLGDHPLHEIDRTGALHNDVEFKGAELQVSCGKEKGCKPYYIKLKEVWAEKGQLLGRDYNDGLHKGKEFLNARFYFNTYGGGRVDRTMIVQSYRFDYADSLHKYVFTYPSDPTYGLHFYTKNNKPIGETGLVASCAQDSEGGIEAVVYEDVHVDMKSGDVKYTKPLLNFACLSGGVGKASLWNYAPWTVEDMVFQTAIRTIRADYLGDGNSWTKAGTPIQVEDKYGLNTFVDPTKKTEAIWTPWGAACIGVPRRPEFTQADVMAEGVADCKDSKLGDWSDNFSWTKIPP